MDDLFQVTHKVKKGGVGNAKEVHQKNEYHEHSHNHNHEHNHEKLLLLIYIILTIIIVGYITISFLEKEGKEHIVHANKILSEIDMYKIDMDLKQYISTYPKDDIQAKSVAKTKGRFYLQKTINSLAKAYSSNMVYMQQHDDSSIKQLLELNMKIKDIKSKILFKLDEIVKNKAI